MVGGWLMMASAPVARPTGWDFPLLWATLPLVAALLLAALAIAWAKKWRQRGEPPERLTTNSQLAHFRSLYERGEISDEEFTRIRGLLGERLKQEMAIGKPANPPASDTPQATPASPERERINHEAGTGQPEPRPQITDDLSSPPREKSP